MKAGRAARAAFLALATLAAGACGGSSGPGASGPPVTCKARAFTPSGGDCTLNAASCDDQHEYELDCGGGTCTCNVNGTPGRSFFSSDFCNAADLAAAITAANAQCGWNVQ